LKLGFYDMQLKHKAGLATPALYNIFVRATCIRFYVCAHPVCGAPRMRHHKKLYYAYYKLNKANVLYNKDNFCIGASVSKGKSITHMKEV